MSQKFVYVKCVEGRPVPRFGSGSSGKIKFIGCKLVDNSWTFYPDKPVRIAYENWVAFQKSYDRAVRKGDLILIDEKEYDLYHNPPAHVEEKCAEIIEEKAEEPQKIEEQPEEDKPAKKKKRRVK